MGSYVQLFLVEEMFNYLVYFMVVWNLDFDLKGVVVVVQNRGGFYCIIWEIYGNGFLRILVSLVKVDLINFINLYFIVVCNGCWRYQMYMVVID